MPLLLACCAVLRPRYHLTDGSVMMSDPSGPLELNGTWFVFPDGARAYGGTQPAFYRSKDLVNWERRVTNKQFSQTGGIAVLPNGFNRSSALK